jgi:hypothetical protein
MDWTVISAEHPSTGDSRDGSGAQWRLLGTVVGLRLREATRTAPIAVQRLVAVDNLGLLDDKHADPLSPRQLLLAGCDVYRDLALKAMTLRENVLVDFPTASLASSGLLKLGRDVVIWLTFQCEACGHLEHHHPGIVKAIGNRRGVLARVLRGGLICQGDEVRHMPSSIAPMSDHWQERVVNVLRRVPANMKVEFRQLAHLSGVPRSYCRVFPKVLSQLPLSIASRAQAGEILDAELRWLGTELFEVSEGLGGAAALSH